MQNARNTYATRDLYETSTLNAVGRRYFVSKNVIEMEITTRDALDTKDRRHAYEMGWLTPNLKLRVRNAFEPRYRRELSDDEVASIANSLVSFVEVYAQTKWREKYGNAKQ